jgi:subtilisin family serine protease
VATPAHASGAPSASAASRQPVGSGTSSWITRGRNWKGGRGKVAFRASIATGPISTAAVPSTLKKYLSGDLTGLQWPLKVLHLDKAWSATKGEGIVVATVDSGVDRSAPDLAGRLLPGAYFNPGSGTVVPGHRADEIGHGTHVAGIIAGNDNGRGMTGVAPGAKVLPINIDTTEEADGQVLASAIAYAVSHGAKVINMSLDLADVAADTAGTRLLCGAVKTAVAKNVVVVVASGNSGIDSNRVSTAASCPGAISVAAVDSNLKAAAWSSFDKTVTVAAPGANVWSSVPTVTTPLGFSAESGTSMAAPHVAGLAALLLAKNPGWTPAQVSKRLTETAFDVPPSGRDPRTGAGVINPAKALGVSSDDLDTVPSLAVAADAYATRVVKGRSVFEKVMLRWVPDASVEVDRYEVTRWTKSGVATTSYSGDTVRALFATGPAGYQVTAVTSGGEKVTSPPVWFPRPGQDTTPIYPVTSLKATWTRQGAVAVTWANPARNRGLVDGYAVFVNGEPVVSAVRTAVPTKYTIPAARVPDGDLSISVLVGATSNDDVVEASTQLAARVPFSGTAVAAGKGRYRVDLVMAPSRRGQCANRCSGVAATVTVGGHAYSSRVDSRGHVVVLVTARPVRGMVTVSVTVPGKAKLSDRSVKVRVG